MNAGLSVTKLQGKGNPSRNTQVRSLKSSGPSDDKQLKLTIHTPILRSEQDCPVQHFESKLFDSVALLKGYAIAQDKNRKLEEELKQGRQMTISALVNELVKRRKDHVVVEKCVNILRSITDEYEKIKLKIAEDAVKKADALRADQSIQCTPWTSHCGVQCEFHVVDVAAQHSIEQKDMSTLPHADLRELVRLETPCANQTTQTEDSLLGHPSSEVENIPPTPDIRIAIRPKIENSEYSDSNVERVVPNGDEAYGLNLSDRKVKKRVRFEEEDVYHSYTDSVTTATVQTQTRVPYGAKAVNMYQRIIPQSVLHRQLNHNSRDSEKPARKNSVRAHYSAQQNSKKLPKFSGKHLAKEELERIYGSEVCNIVIQKHGSSEVLSRCSTQLTEPLFSSCLESVTLKPIDITLPNDVCEPVGVTGLESFKIKGIPSKTALNYTFEDYSPYEMLQDQRKIQTTHQKHSFYRQNYGFFKRVSTPACKRRKNPKATLSSRKIFCEQKGANESEKWSKPYAETAKEVSDEHDSVEHFSSSFLIEDPLSDREPDPSEVTTKSTSTHRTIPISREDSTAL